LFVLDLALIRRIHILFGGVAGADLPFLTQLCAISLALLPVSVTFGWLFQSVATRYTEEGGSLARAYAIESAGGLLGGALATWCFSLGLQNFSIAILGSLVVVTSSLVVVSRQEPTGSPSRTIAVAAFVAGLVLLCTLWRGRAIDRAWTAWNHPRLLDTLDTPYGRTTVSGRLGQIAVFENNALLFESEDTAAEELVHIAASHHPHPQSFLMLGGASQGLIRETQKYHPKRMTAVELDRRAWELISRYLPPAYIQSPTAPRAELRFSDPRQYLTRDSSQYDLILVAMPEPGSAQTARYYTKEFFESCARHLRPNGIVAFRLRSSENLWTPPLTRRTAGILAALRAALPSVIILPGTANLFIASRQALPKDPDLIANLFKERRLQTRLVSPLYIKYLYTNDRLEYLSNQLATVSISPNVDSRPSCYQFTLMIWLSKFYPGLAVYDINAWVTWAKNHVLEGFLAFVALAGAFRLVRRRPAIRRLLLAALAGLLGMVGESALLVRYQIKSGVLYQDLGLLLTLFMAGLVLGSFAVSHVARRYSPERSIPKRFAMGIVTSFCALLLALAWMPESGLFTAMATVGGGLFLTGTLVAGLFAYASLDGVDDPSSVVSPLYAADLLGGCAGSLAASLILIPLVGIDYTFVGMTGIAIIALALL
jgi:spermidine synthase